MTQLTTIGLSALLGTMASLPAIERPAGEKSTEKIPTIPVEPRGGVLGDDEREMEPRKALRPGPPEAVAEKIAFLGVAGEPSSEALLSHLDIESGLLLSTVDQESPAGLAGLAVHDVIVSVDGTQLTDQDTLRAALSEKKPGDQVTLKLIRRGKTIDQEVTLGEAAARRTLPPQALIPHAAGDLNRLLNERMGGAFGGFGNDDLQRELMEQLERAFGENGPAMRQLRLNFGGDLFDGSDLNLGLKQQGSVCLEDKEGSIELKMKDGDRELMIRDADGKLVFEGPYDTAEDKAAVPEEFRDRVEKLDAGRGTSFQFKLNGRDLFGNDRGKNPKGE